MLKPDKEILQNGDHMIIKTLSTFRNYIMEFDVGKEFEEDLAGVDDRKCMVSIRTVTTDQKKKKKSIKTIDNSRPFTDNICKPFCVSVPKIIPVTFFQ